MFRPVEERKEDDSIERTAFTTNDNQGDIHMRIICGSYADNEEVYDEDFDELLDLFPSRESCQVAHEIDPDD